MDIAYTLGNASKTDGEVTALPDPTSFVNKFINELFPPLSARAKRDREDEMNRTLQLDRFSSRHSPEQIRKDPSLLRPNIPEINEIGAGDWTYRHLTLYLSKVNSKFVGNELRVIAPPSPSDLDAKAVVLYHNLKQFKHFDNRNIATAKMIQSRERMFVEFGTNEFLKRT